MTLDDRGIGSSTCIKKCVCMYLYVCVIEFSGNYLQSQFLLISYNFHNFYVLNTNTRTHKPHTYTLIHRNHTHTQAHEHKVKHKKAANLKMF